MENQALKFISKQAKDKQCCRSSQQEYQEYYAKDGSVMYKDWHEMLPFALHAYHTTIRTSTGAKPYSLVYRMEVVMPLEAEIPSLRVLMELELEEPN